MQTHRIRKGTSIGGSFFCILENNSCEALGCQEDAQAGEQQCATSLGAGLQPFGYGSEQEYGHGEHDAAHQADLPEGMLASEACKQRQNAKAEHSKDRNANIAPGIIGCDQMLQVQRNYAQQHHVGNVQYGEHISGVQNFGDHSNHCGHEQHANQHSIEEITIILHSLNLPK